MSRTVQRDEHDNINIFKNTEYASVKSSIGSQLVLCLFFLIFPVLFFYDIRSHLNTLLSRAILCKALDAKAAQAWIDSAVSSKIFLEIDLVKSYQSIDRLKTSPAIRP